MKSMNKTQEKSLNQFFSKKLIGDRPLKGYVNLDDNKKGITNSYSFIILNDIDDSLLDKLDTGYYDSIVSLIKSNVDKFSNFVETSIDDLRSQYYCKDSSLELVGNIEEKNGKTISNYSFNLSYIKNIARIIKADKYSICYDYYNNFTNFIKIENSKTGEVGYLLSTRKY